MSRRLLHEAGHCFHAFASHARPFIWQRHPGAESAELASMSMELLAAPHLAQADRLLHRGRRHVDAARTPRRHAAFAGAHRLGRCLPELDLHQPRRWRRPWRATRPGWRCATASSPASTGAGSRPNASRAGTGSCTSSCTRSTTSSTGSPRSGRCRSGATRGATRGRPLPRTGASWRWAPRDRCRSSTGRRASSSRSTPA